MDQFVVKQESFEGPLDLLLQLIEKRKLHVSDVSLSQVADDYINHVENIEEFPMEQSAHFVLVASTLLLIKSKTLLPTLQLTLEEEQSIDELEDRLKQYKRIKELSVHVEKMFGDRIMFSPERDAPAEVLFTPSSEITKPGILESIKNMLKALPVKEKLAEVVVKKVISLEEAIESLTKRVQQSLKMNFQEFSKTNAKEQKEIKMNVVVSFLAMLELAKRGSIFVNQESHFGDIEIETGDVGVPHY